LTTSSSYSRLGSEPIQEEIVLPSIEQEQTDKLVTINKQYIDRKKPLRREVFLNKINFSQESNYPRRVNIPALLPEKNETGRISTDMGQTNQFELD
jgi:hypothetical protein